MFDYRKPPRSWAQIVDTRDRDRSVYTPARTRIWWYDPYRIRFGKSRDDKRTIRFMHGSYPYTDGQYDVFAVSYTKNSTCLLHSIMHMLFLPALHLGSWEHHNKVCHHTDGPGHVSVSHSASSNIGNEDCPSRCHAKEVTFRRDERCSKIQISL